MKRVEAERKNGAAWGRQYARWLDTGAIGRDDLASAVDNLRRMAVSRDENVKAFGSACLASFERELVKRHMPTGELVFSKYRVAEEASA